MPFRQLFVWVEGLDDQRFVDSILRPPFEQLYEWIDVVPYAEMKAEKIVKFIESIRSMSDTDYIFLSDRNKSPCISARKEALVRKYKSLQPEYCAVVVKEIECWYLAGLTSRGCTNLEITYMGATDNFDKEMFDRLRQPHFGSRVDWMIEMLRHYSLQEAILRNSSLRYFVSKFLPTFSQPPSQGVGPAK
jgi:hypothetical protein